MAPQPDPGVRLATVSRRQSRWLTVFAIGTFAIVALAVAKPWVGPPVVTASPSPAAVVPSAAPPTFQASTLTIRASPLMGGHAWLLDFDQSSLSSFVCLGWEGSICRSPAHLASSIRFEGDQILGDTGVAGGCDQFIGSVDLFKQGLGYLRVTIPTYASRCWGSGVDREIRDRLNRVAIWNIVDGRLVLHDSEDDPLLVYR